MPAPPEHLVEWIEILTFFAGLAAIWFTAREYQRSKAQERAEREQQHSQWLFELFNRLYGDPALREMRVRVDMGNTAFIPADNDPDLMGQLDDFLNFFEFVAYLRARGQLDRKEMLSMFDYPLRKIKGDANLMNYIQNDNFGYEQLRDLLADLR